MSNDTDVNDAEEAAIIAEYERILGLFLPMWTDYPFLRTLSVGRGWYGLLEELAGRFAALEPKAGKINVMQIKEKFGELRVYVGNNDPRVGGVIREFEERANKTCERCGNPGELSVRRYFYLTLCENDRDEGWEVVGNDNDDEDDAS